jgi:hypothetical protein
MLSTNDILSGVLLPAILSGLILLAGIRWASGRAWVSVLALGVPFTLAFACVNGAGHLLPPSGAVDWLFYLGLLFTGVGLVDSSVRLQLWARALAMFLAAGAGAFLLLRFNFINQTWDIAHGVGWLTLLAAVSTIWWACLETVALEGGILLPASAMLILGIGGLAIMLDADQTTGQAMGALAVALAAAAGIAIWRPAIRFARGACAVITGVGVCAIAGAYFISDVPALHLILIAAAPLMLLAGRWSPVRRLWLAVGIRIALLLIPLGFALGLAVLQFRQEQADRSADPYSLGPIPTMRSVRLTRLHALRDDPLAAFSAKTMQDRHDTGPQSDIV